MTRILVSDGRASGTNRFTKEVPSLKDEGSWLAAHHLVFGRRDANQRSACHSSVDLTNSRGEFGVLAINASCFQKLQQADGLEVFAEWVPRKPPRVLSVVQPMSQRSRARVAVSL